MTMNMHTSSVDTVKGVDIRFIDKEVVFSNGTKEHNTLSRMKGREWEEYICLMAKYGVSVEYNLVDDAFVAKSYN